MGTWSIFFLSICMSRMRIPGQPLMSPTPASQLRWCCLLFIRFGCKRALSRRMACQAGCLTSEAEQIQWSDETFADGRRSAQSHCALARGWSHRVLRRWLRTRYGPRFGAKGLRHRHRRATGSGAGAFSTDLRSRSAFWRECDRAPRHPGRGGLDRRSLHRKRRSWRLPGCRAGPR